MGSSSDSAMLGPIKGSIAVEVLCRRKFESNFYWATRMALNTHIETAACGQAVNLLKSKFRSAFEIFLDESVRESKNVQVGVEYDEVEANIQQLGNVKSFFLDPHVLWL